MSAAGRKEPVIPYHHAPKVNSKAVLAKETKNADDNSPKHEDIATARGYNKKRR